jgi:lysylphosphatidylglycerol synthetase-like protein (DUF2156 family)
MEEDIEMEIGKTVRPGVVTVFVILTLVGSSLFLIWNLVAPLMPQEPTSMPQLMWVTIVSAVLGVGKIVGAILMLRMRKVGFYAYAVGEVASAVVGILETKRVLEWTEEALTFTPSPIDPTVLVIGALLFSILLTIVFVAVYASQLHKMH